MSEPALHLADIGPGDLVTIGGVEYEADAGPFTLGGWVAVHLRERYPPTPSPRYWEDRQLITAFELRNKSADHLAYYLALRDGWWGGECALCDDLLVSSGPLKGSVIGACARYKAPGADEVRDVCQLLIRTNSTSGDSGHRREWWDNAATKYQDTYGAVLVRKAVEMGAFDGMAKRRPRTHQPYSVERSAEGHVSRGTFGARDPRVVSVRYADGKVETGTAGGQQ